MCKEYFRKAVQNGLPGPRPGPAGTVKQLNNTHSKEFMHQKNIQSKTAGKDKKEGRKERKKERKKEKKKKKTKGRKKRKKGREKERKKERKKKFFFWVLCGCLLVLVL